MKVLLISANTETINMPVLPLGLSCIARAADEAGHDIRVVNTLDAEQLIPEAARAVQSFRPDLIGISVRNIDDQAMAGTRFLLEPVKELIADIRRQSGAAIVVGGAGYSIFAEPALRYLDADMGLRGPAERSFVRLLERLEKNEDPVGIPGLYLPGQTPAALRDPADDINDFPLPGPDDLPLSPETAASSDLWIPFQTRRGCAMECSYCSTAAIEGHATRYRDTNRAADTLADYARAGFSRFFFVDNTFNLPPDYAHDLCDKIIARNLDISWRGIVYPWKIDAGLAKKMAAAGCTEVSLGFESGSAAILMNLNKKFKPDDIREAAALLKGAGIQQTGFLLLGAPGETPATVAESLAFVEALDLEAMKITCGIRIYPETRLARRAAAEGVIAPTDDLLFPRFYVAAAVRDTLSELVAPWMEKHDNWF